MLSWQIHLGLEDPKQKGITVMAGDLCEPRPIYVPVSAQGSTKPVEGSHEHSCEVPSTTVTQTPDKCVLFLPSRPKEQGP